MLLCFAFNELFILRRNKVVDIGQDEATACSLLKEMALQIHELVGARMHHLSVCQWEVKLKLDSDGPANGTWRVVTTNVTSHTCTVDVSSFSLHLVFLCVTNQTKANLYHLFIELLCSFRFHFHLNMFGGSWFF